MLISKLAKQVAGDHIVSDNKVRINTSRLAGIAQNEFLTTMSEYGVGGLDPLLKQIWRRIIVMRNHPDDLENQIRGILLYGRPGTGKTLLAQQLSKYLGGKTKVIKGPELLDQYVGETERKIRGLFADAAKDTDCLHVLIFDEFEAISRTRATVRGGPLVHDTAVAMLLSLIDGCDRPKNLLMIATTNRRDLIDTGFLRPGRFEVQLEVSFPDELGRVQILQIHAKKLKENGRLADDVDFLSFAKETANFTGAEIESLIRNAVSHAIKRTHDENPEIVTFDKLKGEDIRNALQEIEPSFGKDLRKLRILTQPANPRKTESNQDSKTRLLTLFNQFKAGAERSCSILLHGDPERLALAARCALEANFTFCQLIDAELLLGLTKEEKIETIVSIFKNADSSSQSVIVIDDLEKIIGLALVEPTPMFSNDILQTISTLLTKSPKKQDSQVLVIATTNKLKFFSSLEVDKLFHHQIDLSTSKEM